jgi:hypothetical protein
LHIRAHGAAEHMGMNVDEQIIAMIALKESTRIDATEVAERVKTMFPWIAQSVGVPGPGAEGNDAFMIPIGDAAVAVVPIHLPIPQEALVRAIGMNWLWPEAQQAFAQSRAHLIVSALTQSNDPRYMRTNAQRVTCVTAVLAEMLPAAGVYWSTAEHVVEPDRFVAEAKEHAEQTPYDLWVATEFYPGPKFQENQEIIARTSGMHVFIGREVECGPCAKEPGELGPIVHMVGWYVLDRNVQFRGGEVIGSAEEPIGTVRLARTQVGTDAIATYLVTLDDAPQSDTPNRKGAAV